MAAVGSELWDQASEQLLRAERLLERLLSSVAEGQTQHRRDRDRMAFELEQLLPPLEGLSSTLLTVVEEMAQHRQDNRLQRWQGQLQGLFSLVDSSVYNLREGIALLDQPLELSANVNAADREAPRRQQLNELLVLRQKQVLQLQAELTTLQRQLFALQPQGEQDASEAPASDQSAPPNVFS